MDAFFEDYLERFTELFRDYHAAIDGLPDAALDWVPGPQMNSLCVLVVHICGATRYWVGDVALGEESGRDRAAEFRANGLELAALKHQLDETEAYVRAGVARLELADLDKMCPAPGRRVRPDSEDLREFRLGWSLLHTLEHAGMHLGHAQITRQLWDQRVV